MLKLSYLKIVIGLVTPFIMRIMLEQQQIINSFVITTIMLTFITELREFTIRLSSNQLIRLEFIEITIGSCLLSPVAFLIFHQLN